jgi:hypothetical protein
MTCSNLTKLGAGLAVAIALAAPGSALADITFDGLAGSNGDVFTTYSEDGLTITAIGGVARVAKNFGNPVPDLYYEAGQTVTLEVTAGGDLFSFDSWDFAGNNGVTSWTIKGFNGGNESFTSSDSGDTSGGGFGFITVASGTNLTFDRLTFTFDVGGTSSNFDNFVGNVAAVPEPATWGLMIAGFGLAGGALRRRHRLAHA